MNLLIGSFNEYYWPGALAAGQVRFGFWAHNLMGDADLTYFLFI